MGDVSHAIQQVAEGAGLSVVRSLVGHGVGRSMHEDPQVPNYGKPGKGPLLEEGMVLAVEPMTTAGRPAVRVGGDGWAIFTQDSSLGGPLRVHRRDHRRGAEDPHAVAPERRGALARACRRGRGERGLSRPRERPHGRRAQAALPGARTRKQSLAASAKLLAWGVLPEATLSARPRAYPRFGSGGRNGSQSRVAGTQPPKGIMKVRPSVKPMCEKCKIIRRNGVVLVICQNKRHKQRQG